MKNLSYLEIKKQLPFLIPEQYNDAMSYQELLYAVISLVNEMVENINEIPDTIETDVTTEIQKLIDDGTIKGLINEQIFSDLNAKINNLDATVTANYNTLNDSKISNDKILSKAAFDGTVSERGFLGDAKDIKDSLNNVYEKFNPAVVSQTGAPTLSSGVTGTPILKRFGKIVSLTFSLQITTAFSAQQTIFTIPTGYRPTGSTYFVVQIAGGNNSNSARITTDGVFVLPNNTIAEGSFIVGSVTYICE